MVLNVSLINYSPYALCEKKKSETVTLDFSSPLKLSFLLFSRVDTLDILQMWKICTTSLFLQEKSWR